MSITTTAGLAEGWAVTRVDQRQQAVQIAALRQQAQAEKAVAGLVQEAAQAAAPPAPEGQGRQVDIRV